MLEKLNILLVDDTPSDVRLTQEALKHSTLDFCITVAEDGEEALSYLRRTKAAGKALPQLILLDLNMPRKNGHEVLDEIKSDSGLERIPVVLLTVSERAEDIWQALQSKMNYYLPKPVSSEKLCALVKAIHEINDDDCEHTGTQSREESHIRFVLAGNPHTPLKALTKLAGDLSKKIRAKVAENPLLTEDLQMRLAKDTQSEVRVSLCENGKLFPSVAAVLAVDESADVRLAVCSSSSTSMQVLEQLTNDENAFVGANARKFLALREQ